MRRIGDVVAVGELCTEPRRACAWDKASRDAAGSWARNIGFRVRCGGDTFRQGAEVVARLLRCLWWEPVYLRDLYFPAEPLR